jgi:hypothetical protein
MRISVKLAPTFPYPELERFWREADRSGFEAVWNYDHFYGLVKDETPSQPTRPVDRQLRLLPRYEEVGCQHAVLSFYQPPSIELLEQCASLSPTPHIPAGLSSAGDQENPL